MTGPVRRDLSLNDRVAVVSHAASDLGPSICAALVRAGAKVVAGDGQASVSPAPESVRASAGPVDADWLDSLDGWVGRAAADYGRVDIVVNTHVIVPGAAAESMPLEAFRRGIALNLNAIFFGCQSAARQMLRQSPPGGTIVNVTSVGAVVALPGHASFCAAMAGANAVTKILATEWGPRGIRVVGVGAGLSAELVQALSVHPRLPDGETAAHRRVPPRVLTSAGDVAGVVVYLAGDEARHIAGTTLYVDGGWLADGYWE